MDNDNAYRKQQIEKYRAVIDPFFRFIPWFKDRMGTQQAKTYEGKDIGHSIAFPVYDSTLLNFVKGMQAAELMDRNYPYVYSHYGIRGTEDEIYHINNATLKDIEIILGIMSKYVLGGMTKGLLWTDAVEKGIFYYSLVRMKEILEVWDQPRA